MPMHLSIHIQPCDWMGNTNTTTFKGGKRTSGTTNLNLPSILFAQFPPPKNFSLNVDAIKKSDEAVQDINAL